MGRREIETRHPDRCGLSTKNFSHLISSSSPGEYRGTPKSACQENDMTRTRSLFLGAAIIAVCAGAIWSACNESSLAPASPPSDTESTSGVEGRSESPSDRSPGSPVTAQQRPEPQAPDTEDDDAIRRRALLFFMAQTLDETNPDWMTQVHQVISDARIESSRREMLRAIVAAAGTDLGDAEKRYIQRNPRFFQQIGAKLRDETYFRGLRDKAIKRQRVRSGQIDNRNRDDCGGLPVRVSTRATIPVASAGSGRRSTTTASSPCA